MVEEKKRERKKQEMEDSEKETKEAKRLGRIRDVLVAYRILPAILGTVWGTFFSTAGALSWCLYPEGSPFLATVGSQCVCICVYTH